MHIIKSIIGNRANERTIIKACQDYLIDYENGKRSSFTPEIDLILEQLGR